MNDRLILSQDDVLYLLYMYSEDRFSYTFNILIDKNSGRKYFLLDNIYNLPGTVIKNKRRYLEANVTTIQLVKEDEESIFDKYISEYHLLAVLLKSNVMEYRKLSKWLLNEVYPDISRKLLEESLETKDSLIDNSVVNKIVTEVNGILEKYKKERREEE